MWRSSILDRQDPPNPETTGSSGILIGLAWGVNNGILDRQTYQPVVEKAWQGLTSLAVHKSGLLGYCQPVGGSPKPVPPCPDQHLYQHLLPPPFTNFVFALELNHVDLFSDLHTDMTAELHVHTYRTQLLRHTEDIPARFAAGWAGVDERFLHRPVSVGGERGAADGDRVMK